MSQQRVPFVVRDEALSGLRDWWADRIDQSGFNQLCGNTAQTDTRYTGLQATVAPSANQLKTATGVAAENSLTAAATFTLALIDSAVEAARTNTPAIRPVTVEGKNFYCLFLHPYQVTDMRESTTTGQWLN